MGFFSQRAALHDPSDLYTSKFYGGRPDAIWSGSNVELTNRLTLQRRPGLTALSTFTYPTPPDYAYSFQLSDGTIRLMIDTAATDASAAPGAGGLGSGASSAEVSEAAAKRARRAVGGGGVVGDGT